MSSAFDMASTIASVTLCLTTFSIFFIALQTHPVPVLRFSHYHAFVDVI